MPARHSTASTVFSRRRMLAGLGIAGLGTAALSACAAGTSEGSGASDAGSEDDQVRSFGSGSKTFTILSIIASLPEEELKQFAQENDCKVVVEEYAFDKLTAMLAAGTPPDLVRGMGGVDTPYLATKKLAEPLTDYMADSSVLTEDRLDPVNDVWRYDGTQQGKGDLYGVAKDYSYDMDLWVNADLVGEKPDLKKPWTYDQVLELSRTAHKESGGRVEAFGYGNYLALPDVQFLDGMIATTDQDLWSADYSKVDFTTEAGVAAVEFVRTLWKENLTPSPVRPSSEDLYKMFEASRLGTFQSGYWTQAMFTSLSDADMKKLYMVPPPVLGDTQISPVLSATGYWIPAAAKDKELSFKFMEFHLAGKSATDRAASGWGIPIIKDDQKEMPDKTLVNKRVLECTDVDKTLFQVRSFTPYAKVDALNLELNTAFENGVKADSSAKEIAKDATDRLNAQLERGKR